MRVSDLPFDPSNDPDVPTEPASSLNETPDTPTASPSATGDAIPLGISASDDEPGGADVTSSSSEPLVYAAPLVDPPPPESHGVDPSSDVAAETAQPPNASPSTPRPSKHRRVWSNRVSLLLVAALVGGLAGHFAASNSNGSTVNTDNSSPGGAVLPNGMTIPALVQRVDPSIVSIDVKSGGAEDQGTGMIISSNGYVVTNNHVIAAAVNSGTITVTRTGSTKALPATLIGTNPIDDVALIKINNISGLPTVTFGNSNALVVGDAVVAIGNALGLAAGTPTVTSGIVSALGRTVTAGSTDSTETLNNMIQTDAAINPGNSGGPLLDSKGDVIGMNTAVAGTLPDGTSAQNIGFAIPVATIQSLLKQLMAGESVVNHGAFIGVEILTLTPAIQAQYGFSVSSGAVVMSVIAGTGAADAGVKQGDIIVGINSTTITSTQDLSSVLSGLRPGDVVTLHIVRGTKHLSLQVTLGRQPKG